MTKKKIEKHLKDTLLANGYPTDLCTNAEEMASILVYELAETGILDFDYQKKLNVRINATWDKKYKMVLAKLKIAVAALDSIAKYQPGPPYEFSCDEIIEEAKEAMSEIGEENYD